MKFKSKPGQVDYTNIRYAPVINCVVKYRDKILIVKRSPRMRLYPGYWNGIGGFLDDSRTLEEKVREELNEELGIVKRDIISIQQGRIFEADEKKYRKVWIIHPVLVKVKTDKIKLNWEAEDYRWIKPKGIRQFKVAPSFFKVLKSFFIGLP